MMHGSSINIPTYEQLRIMHGYVDKIKAHMSQFGVNVPFFIAGGSIFSTITGTKFNDFDIYFYNENDLETAIKSMQYLTVYTNAINMDFSNSELSEHPVQFITKNTGTIEDILSDFDLSCSKCAITSDKKFVVSKDFSDKLFVYNLHFSTLERYYKYLKKGGIDKNCKTFKTIIKKLITLRDKNIQCFYFDAEKTGVSILNNYCAHCDTEAIQIIHDIIIKTLAPYDAVNMFRKMRELLNVASAPHMKRSVELSLCIMELDANDNLIIGKKEQQIVKQTYPEYFI